MTTMPAVDLNAVAASLESRLRDKVQYIATRCFPDKVREHVGKAGEMILAAKELGVPELKDTLFVITDQGREELIAQLKRFRTLDMGDHALALLCEVLSSHGVPEHFYLAPPAQPLAELPPAAGSSPSEEDGATFAV